jgi:hypothetical protein
MCKVEGPKTLAIRVNGFVVGASFKVNKKGGAQGEDE